MTIEPSANCKVIVVGLSFRRLISVNVWKGSMITLDPRSRRALSILVVPIVHGMVGKPWISHFLDIILDYSTNIFS